MLRYRLDQHLTSRDVQRALRKLRQMSAEQSDLADWELILSAILLIETRERPRIIRIVERIVSTIFWRRGTTCGYFQMKMSPLRFSVSVRDAVERLEGAGCEPNQGEAALTKIARFWHGAASRQDGESVGYAKALAVALVSLKGE